MERIQKLTKKAKVINTIILISIITMIATILALKFVVTSEVFVYILCVFGLLGTVGIMIGMYMLGHADGKLEEAKSHYESCKNDDNTKPLKGQVVTGLKMSDGSSVEGYIVGLTPFTYIIPHKDVEACCVGQQQVEIHSVAERVLAHT